MHRKSRLPTPDVVCKKPDTGPGMGPYSGTYTRFAMASKAVCKILLALCPSPLVRDLITQINRQQAALLKKTPSIKAWLNFVKEDISLVKNLFLTGDIKKSQYLRGSSLPGGGPVKSDHPWRNTAKNSIG